MEFRCRACGRHLTAQLAETDLELTCEDDGQPYVQQGHYVISDGSYFTGSEGLVVVNLADGKNLRMHPDMVRSQGCCGPAGTDGPNRVCLCGAEVGIEKSDCWMPHALLLLPDAVERVG